MHTGFWWRNMKETDHLEDPGIRTWVGNFNMDVQEVGKRVLD